MTPGESQLNETYCPHGIAVALHGATLRGKEGLLSPVTWVNSGRVVKLFSLLSPDAGIAEPAPVPGPCHSGSGLTDLCYSSFPLGVKWSDTNIGRASEAGTAISQ